MGKSLRQLFLGHKGKVTDKWALYLDEWERLFSPYRNLAINLLEIGIQNGGSLEVWSEYFTKAGRIIGCDIDEKSSQLRYADPRITVVVGDINTEDCERSLLDLAPGFDILIDDASHHSPDIIRTFARYFPHLKEGGLYLVEDLHASYWNDFGGGLHNPLSAMAFFKRLADQVNHEHWRNDQPRSSELTGFATRYGINFKEYDLARIHSVEIINSLCVIKKSPPERNVLGRRVVVGTEQAVAAGWEKLDGTSISDHQAQVVEDAGLDVFALLKKARVLGQQVAQKEKSIFRLSSQVADKDKTVQAYQSLVAEAERTAQLLTANLSEREQALQMQTARADEEQRTAKTLAARVEERDRSIQDLSTRLAEISTQLGNLAQILVERDQSLRALQRHVTRKERTLAHLQADKAAKEQENQELVAQVALKDQSLRDLADRNEEKERSLQEKERSISSLGNQLRLITTSKTWKAITRLRRFRPLWVFLSILAFPFHLRQNWRIKKQVDLLRSSGLFEAGWYLLNNPDVARARMDPARHYLLYGGFEGRDPGPGFSSKGYQAANPDVAAAGMNPLLHYLEFGRQEGRALPGKEQVGRARVGVVVVSYNASLAVRATLASLRRAENSTPYELVLVDNASEPGERTLIQAALTHHAAEGQLAWHYLQLNENRGFAGGNNAGIEMLLKDDTFTHICLLNSDVIVTDHWLDRLVQAGVHLVSPVTNRSASLQAVPTDYEIDLTASMDASHELLHPSAFDRVNAFAQDWYHAWQGHLVPTSEDVTYFCVLFTKDLLHKAGLLDERFYPGGYEDYDYNARVRALGIPTHIARDVYIHHWGSASFGQVPRETFDRHAERNRAYLEEKHNLTVTGCPHAPILSFALAAAFHLEGRGDPTRQSHPMKLYDRQITELLAHHDSEFTALRGMLLSNGREIPAALKQQVEAVAAQNNTLQEWRTVTQDLHGLEDPLARQPERVKAFQQDLSRLADEVHVRAECNVGIARFLFGPVTPVEKGQLDPGRKGLKRFFWVLGKGLSFFWKLKGVVVFGGYPYPEREKDGYYQRIRAIDTLLSSHWRIYFDQVPLAGRDNWYDRPEPNTLVLRVYNGQSRKWRARFIALLCVLRCRAIYFHSILSMRGPAFLMHLPGITRIVDIHGVVPEEFRYHEDPLNAAFYERYEKLALKKATLVIVVSDSMRRHLQEKYRHTAPDRYVLLPIIPEITADDSHKPYVDGRPIVIYAGGLQKWQQVPKMIDAISSSLDSCLHRFYCPRPDEFKALLPKNVLRHAHLLIDSKPYQELLRLYPACHYGFTLREDIIVNRVACPTKLVEYIATGIVPILDTPNIGDFVSLGMQYVPLQDFLEGHLPAEAVRDRMAQENCVVYEKMRAQYLSGGQILRKSLRLGGDLGNALKNPGSGEAGRLQASPLPGADGHDQRLTECDILVQVDNFLSGGLENVVLSLNQALNKAGWRVGMLVLGEAGQAVERARLLGIPVQVGCYERGKYELLLRDLAPRLVISHYSMHGAEVCSSLKIPLLQVVHNVYMWMNPAERREFGEVARHTLAYLFYSSASRDYSVARLGIPPEKCVLMPIGVDIPGIKETDITAERRRLRTRHMIADDDFVFLSVAAITHQKNHLGAIRAFKLALPECPQARLVIVGPVYEQGLLTEMQAYIREQGLGGKIILAGASDRVFGYFAMADAFLCASFFEGGPLVLLEALASNLPIVSTQVGYANWLKDVRGVSLVPPPVDILEFEGNIQELHSTARFERSFASRMRNAYRDRIRPDLNEEVLAMLDERSVNRTFVQFIAQFLQDPQNPSFPKVDSWADHIRSSPRTG